MAINLSSTPKVFTPSWNGNRDSSDPITVVVKRVLQGDFWRIQVIVEALINAMNSKDLSTKAEEIDKNTQALKPLFTKYTESLTNLSVDGKPISSTDIIEHPSLLALSIEIVSELIIYNTLDDNSKKK